MKKLIFNEKHPEGIVVDMTKEEIAALNENIPVISYEERVVNRIRQKYSIDDELAILRQRDTKPEEFAAYNTAVEQIKSQERSAEYERSCIS